MGAGPPSAADIAEGRDAEWEWIIRDAARHLYSHAAVPDPLQRLWWIITHRYPERLLSLSDVFGPCELRERRYLGTQFVALDDIRGSERRAEDFDRLFRPMRHADRRRWLRAAILNLRGADPRPVELIRVGGVYFVRDGHYRVSVARALGQRDILAVVTEWEVACSQPLPWQGEAPPSPNGP